MVDVIKHARSEEFVRTGEVYWNKGTSIKILSTAHVLTRKNLGVFLLDALKAEF